MFYWDPNTPMPGTPGYDDATLASITGSDIQEVSITDLISEGPIEGLVNGEASVYLAGDQLSDINRVLVEGAKAEETGEPHTITFAAASSFNQPVTASLKDRAGNTAYFNNLTETYTNEYVYRWLTVHSTSSAKVKIERITKKTHSSAGVSSIGDIRLCAVASTSPFAETTFFAQSFKSAQRGGVLFNLKPIIRVKLPSGQIIKGDLISTHDTGYSSQLNSGSTKRAIFKPISTIATIGIEENDVYADDTNEVYGEVFIDRAIKVEIRTISSNNVIYIPKNSDALAVTDKEFTLGSEITIKGSSTTGGTPDGSQKYPGSSLEFRVGNRIQEPFYQIAGQGTASFPVSLTGNQGDNFDNTNSYPTSIPSGYPDLSSLPTGMVQKVIVFSTSFTSAQINEIDRIKINFEFPGGHYAMDEEGEDLQSGAAFNIELQGSESGGANPTDWKDLTGGAFKYQKWFGVQKTAITYTVEIPVNTFLDIKDMRLQVTRLTPDGQSNSNNHTGRLNGAGYIIQGQTSGISAVMDNVKINQVIAIIDEKLEHPYSAMASVRFSSKSFTSPPKRAYHVRGMKVKIPSNYTPRHLSATGVATYTGLWNGEFSDEGTSNSSSLGIGTYYTDNPAWIFYDILINNRYGLGDFLTQADINKFQLYKIAKYCDELVPTRDGGTEPRFTANLYLTKATEAYKVLKDMATIFRGMLYWMDGQMSTIQDAPATPIYNFSESNILEGTLVTQNTASKSRANQITVVWNNPLSAYKQEPLIIEDRDNIIETGRILRRKAVAFGCTSEGQAIRFGRWKAWTAINQTEIATFKTSVNASFLQPGDVVNVQSKATSGVNFSGRISASSNSAITLDRDIASISSEAQVDGGATETFTFQSGSDYSYALTLVVMKRTVVLQQDASVTVTHGGTAYTYNRGDTVTYGKIAGTSTQLITNSDSDEQVKTKILNIQDDNGNDMIVEFRNSTSVETKSFTSSNVSVVNGVTQIAISSAFSGTIPSSTVWGIKETFKNRDTLPSYKEYKILGIKQDKDDNFEIHAVEFYNSKFDAIDKDTRIAIEDPVNRPEPALVPQPEAVYVFETPRHKQQNQELQVMWETPINSDGTEYEHLRSFVLHIEPKLPDGTDLIDITNASRRLMRFNDVPDGIFNFGVQTISKEGRRSEIKWQVIDVKDKFKVSCSRSTQGVPLGIRSNTKMSSDTSTWSMNKADWAMQSPGAPGTVVDNANTGTAATHQQSLTALSSGDRGYIYFDADATTDYFKLAAPVAADFENTSQGYWRDLTQYAADAENDWTDCTNNADARVTVAPRTNKVIKSEGTTAFLSRFQIGDIIRIKYDSNKYVGAQVAFIQDDDTLYVDRRLNHTDSTITSVDEAKAIARNTLRNDTANDALIARVSRDGSNYTHTPINWIEDVLLTGLRALIVDSNITILNYNAAGSLQNNAAITITADATAYTAPEFQVTGGGFSGVSTSADGGFSTTGVSGQTLTKQIHNGSTTIAMGDKSPLEFTVAVRESSDQSNAKSKTFRIAKVQDGTVGDDGDDGAEGKRSVQGYIYFRTTNSTNPFASGGTATYNFTSGTITGNLSTGLQPQATAAGGYSNQAYIVDITSSDYYWTARYSYTDSSAGTTSNTVSATITAAVAHTVFSGVVTFNNGTNQFNLPGGTAVTTIDGGSIKTGRIESATFGTTGGTTGGGTRLELVTTSLNDSDSVLEIRDKTGASTFKITKDGSISSTVLQTNSSNKTDGEVGGWEITSTTIRGVVGTDNLTLDSANNRITITDDGTERVRIGKLT